jgi:hypothetical protein
MMPMPDRISARVTLVVQSEARGCAATQANTAGCRPHQLGQHIGIEHEDQSNRGGSRAGSRDGISRSSAPPRGAKRSRVRLGDALAALGRKVGLTDEDTTAIDQTRDGSPAKPKTLE